MNRTITLFGICLLIAWCTGCIDTEIIVKLKPDGSGTLEKTVIMNKNIQEQMGSMMGSLEEGFGSSPNPESDNVFNLYNVEELKEQVVELGEGVSYVSSKPLTTKKGQGYTVVYSFKDVTKLTINQNPGENIPANANRDTEKGIQEQVTFSFSKGKKESLVTIHSPLTQNNETLKENKEIENQEHVSEDALEQIKEVFDGMRMALILEIDGKLIKTNATHVNKNTVTIMDMDFNKLLKNPKALMEFANQDPNTVEEAKKLVQNVPGIKVDMNEAITISFKP